MDLSKKDETIEEEIEKESQVMSIICPQCGSADIELISDDLGTCKSCGTQVVIDTPKETNVVTNNVTIQMEQSFGSTPIIFGELPIETEKDKFFIEALTQIANDKNSPDDVFTSSQIELVQTKYFHYLVGEGNVDMTYSATIGYDRQEVYYERVRKYDASTKDYYYDNVKKTRTVTDWKPFSAVHRGSHYGFVDVENCEESDLYDYISNCRAKAKEYNEESNTPAPLVPTDHLVTELKSSIEKVASIHCEESLPGDRKKDFSSSGTVSLTKVESHVAPRYILTYKYNNEEYYAGAHTVEGSKIKSKIPSAAKENEKEIENYAPIKAVNLATFFVLLFAILSSILFPMPLKITFTVIAIVLFIANCIVKNVLSKKIYIKKVKAKKNDLVSLLKKKGIEIPKQLREEI